MKARDLRRRVANIAAAVALLGCVSTAAPGAPPAPEARPDDAVPPAVSDAATTHHTFEDVAHWVSVFDDPARDAWQKPAGVTAALRLRPGMAVADLGAGTGYFSRYLAAAVGESGTVFAADTEPGLVVHLRQRAEREHTANVVPVLASADNPRLPAGAIDVVLIVNTVHHLDDRRAYLRRLRRVLKPGGRIAVVDYKKEDLPVGPPPDHKLAREQIVDEFGRAGYRLVGEPDILPYQYFLIFQAR